MARVVTSGHEYVLLVETRYNTVQHVATHCNTLPHDATPYNTMQHNGTYLLEKRKSRQDMFVWSCVVFGLTEGFPE